MEAIQNDLIEADFEARPKVYNLAEARAFVAGLPASFAREWHEDDDLHFTVGACDGRLYITYWEPIPEEPNDPDYQEMWALLWDEKEQKWFAMGTRAEVERQLTERYLASSIQ